MLLCANSREEVNICQVIFSLLIRFFPAVVNVFFIVSHNPATFRREWSEQEWRRQVGDEEKKLCLLEASSRRLIRLWMAKLPRRIVEQTFYVFITQHLATDKYFLMITKSPRTDGIDILSFAEYLWRADLHKISLQPERRERMVGASQTNLKSRRRGPTAVHWKTLSFEFKREAQIKVRRRKREIS